MRIYLFEMCQNREHSQHHYVQKEMRINIIINPQVFLHRFFMSNFHFNRKALIQRKQKLYDFKNGYAQQKKSVELWFWWQLDTHKNPYTFNTHERGIRQCIAH